MIIQTRILSPTNHRGTRIKAFTDSIQTIVSWDHNLNPERNQERAAEALVKRIERAYNDNPVNQSRDYHERLMFDGRSRLPRSEDTAHLYHWASFRK